MSWDEEREQYIAKLECIVSGVEKILKLPSNSIVTPDIEKPLRKISDDANILLNKLKRNEFEIAVVGLEKAGKSSFSNAFIGFSALPTDDQRCTYTSTCIRATREGENPCATITFYSRNEFFNDFCEKLNKLNIPDADKYSPETLSLTKYEQLFADCDSDIKEKYQDSLNQDIREILENWSKLKKYIDEDKRTVDLETSRDFIRNPDKAIAVKDVVITTDQFKEMKDAVMYDVPGFNSPTAMHREQTLAKMRDADAIIMLADASSPSITGESLKIVRDFEKQIGKQDKDGEELKGKLFIFANKADRATDLKENKRVTYEEWIKKRKILADTPEGHDRIIFGSAIAHLDSTEANVIKARETLAQQGCEDGINILQEKLITYYKTARFEACKKRVGRIISSVEELFVVKRSEFATDDTMHSDSEAYKILLNSANRLKDNIEKSLYTLKENICTESNEKRPLTAEIRERIVEIVTDQYVPSDEEIHEIHKSIASISSSKQPIAIDTALRKRRFDDMYNDFTKVILSCTGSQHKSVVENILDCFMNAMGIGRGTSNYATLQERIVTTFCELGNGQDDDFYQSLMERFARDLFEVQIKCSQGQDRLYKFKDEAANFFSLGVFYSFSSTKDKDDLSYIDATPSASPLWKNILYPENATEIDRDGIIEEFQKLTGIDKLSDAIRERLNTLIAVKGSGAIEALNISFRTFPKDSPQARLMAIAKDTLDDLLSGSDSDPATHLREILTSNRYTDDISARRQVYSYATVKKEFEDDIRSLRLSLLNAFTPAVNIDKAFSAREAKLIEDIVRGLREERFDNFIANNIYLIESEKMERIESAQAQRKADSAVMSEINGILAKITHA